MTYLKIAIITTAMLAVSGTAFAGENCKDKKKTAMKTETAGQTAVLGASERLTKIKGAKTVLTFDEALEKCQAKGAKDLQACIDYKTGKTEIKAKAAPHS